MPYSLTTFEASFSVTVDGGLSAESPGIDATVAILRLYNDNGSIEKVALAVYQRDSPVNHTVFAGYLDHNWLVYEDRDHPTRWMVDTTEEPTLVLDFHTEEDYFEFLKLMHESRSYVDAVRSRQRLILENLVAAMRRDELPEPPAYIEPPGHPREEPLPELIPERTNPPIVPRYAFVNTRIAFAADSRCLGALKMDWSGASGAHLAIVEVVPGLYGIVICAQSTDDTPRRRESLISTVINPSMTITSIQSLRTITFIESHTQFHVRFDTPAEWAEFIHAWMGAYNACEAFRATIRRALDDAVENFPPPDSAEAVMPQVVGDAHNV
ncbi:hypothetical protein C8Q76DRAFT_797225 [Earliella scabrosa]|nr:hypothetical protein C8Q76DRAFT_797225 [Earliella scabrosa]